MHLNDIKKAADLIRQKDFLLLEERDMQLLKTNGSHNVTIGGRLIPLKAGDLEDLYHVITSALRRDRHAIDQQLVDLGVTL